MKLRNVIALCFSALLFAASAGAQSAAPEDARLAPAWERIHAFASAMMEQSGTPGLALAVTSRQRLLHAGALGYADLKLKTPLTPEALFEIGSISKSFTAIALMQLAEQGKFDPHQPVSRYLPWFRVPTRFAPITGHHLLTHTAGIPRDRDQVPASLYQAAGAAELWTGYPPGRRYAYSNIGYQILGYLVEEIAGRPYGEVIASAILRPAGMTASEPVITHDTRRRLAVGYRRMYDDRPAHASHPLVEATWLEYGGGDGSIASTPADLAAYTRMILNGGVAGGGRRILSEESFARLTLCGIRTGENECYAYGLSVSTAGGRTVLSHGGGMVGYTSMLLADMDAGLGVVVLVNGPGSAGAVAQFALNAVRAALAGEPLPALPPAPRPERVPNAAEYAGTFASPDGRTLELVAEGESLLLVHAGERIALERRGGDAFYVRHPGFALFLLRFARQNNRVVEASFGPDWYTNEHYSGPKTFDTPAEWAACAGHYRSYSPWLNGFRVVLRKGRLWLMHYGGGEVPLVPLTAEQLGPEESGAEGWFQAGEGETAERIRFDTIVRGQAQRATLTGAAFYRTFTP